MEKDTIPANTTVKDRDQKIRQMLADTPGRSVQTQNAKADAEAARVCVGGGQAQRGLYRIETEGWVPMRPQPPRAPGRGPSAEELAFANPARPTVFQIFAGLGLKLKNKKARVEMFAIENVEKPSAN